MQEHEYRARDKTVKKMSRDGLKEENLHSRKSIRVSNRETDDFFCATQAEDMEDFSKHGEHCGRIRCLPRYHCGQYPLGGARAAERKSAAEQRDLRI